MARSPGPACRWGRGMRRWVAALGAGGKRLRVGQRVGIPWLGWTCGACRFCLSWRENLCPDARFTGYTRDGGDADHYVADQRYCLPLEDGRSDAEAAPLLCAGLGYRALRWRRTRRATREAGQRTGKDA